ncbi:MAG TPA: hypothetical protein VGP72_10540 [Planctomycetota bacterium]|jgi:hypothetical protein
MRVQVTVPRISASQFVQSSGFSGFSGAKGGDGSGISGWSGAKGDPGEAQSGFSGAAGAPGEPGPEGASTSGYSGWSGAAGAGGTTMTPATNGADGVGGAVTTPACYEPYGNRKYLASDGQWYLNGHFPAPFMGSMPPFGTPTSGDAYFDPSNANLYVFDGSNWRAFTPTT